MKITKKATYKENLGKILFIISILILCYMFITPLNSTFIHIDEHYTLGMLQLSFDSMCKRIMTDVHPPLYYFILLSSLTLLKTFNIQYNLLFVTKVLSIIPYFILLIISITKIRKDHNWFTSGLFIFSIGIMGNTFIQFLTVRMYSWGLLFLVLSYIYLKDILEKSDLKSWSLFTIFNILGIYTHNILLISTGILYVILLAYYFLNKNIDKKSEIKKWVISSVVVILSYLPWLFVLLSQMSSKHSNGLSVFGINEIIQCFLSFASYNFNILLYLITALFICLIAIITINKIFDEGYMENYYVLAGIILFVLTLVISAIILPVFIGPTSPRYLVPVSGVLWLSLSIIIDKIEKEKILTIILILLLLMGCLNFISILESTNNIYQSNQKEMNMLNEMNNENSVVIHTRYFEYQCYHDDLNKTKEYSLKKFDTVFPEGLDNQKDVAKIMDENPGKTVYMIDYKDQKINQNVKKEVIANKGAYSFTKLSLNNTNSST